ncbi:hypothetical protein AGDE_05813 [Angomonas deanei]|nr:hypothetical protein AGDE_05813 [Angomonas deanei]|eukprot:EPY38118.1 hypothetical protein AGDE_05813 [Angomonas deanei]
MKRDHDGAMNPNHPLIGFNREVLNVQQWTIIRRDFLACLQAEKRICWQEPNKLWRHSQEALGKWILSQIARAGDEVDMLTYHFFPTDSIRRTFPNGESYDEQLVRDLSIKSNGVEDSGVSDIICGIVKQFQLARRCTEAAQRVDSVVQEMLGGSVAKPKLRKVEEGDPTRTPAQKRIRGPLAEVAVQWPSSKRGEATKNCPPVSIPWAAFCKLRRSFDHLSAKGEAALYRTCSFTDEDIFLCRAAAVMLRYEGGLATGSLQLCADTLLKQHLHARGYRVMDLCASPINAYMGVPRVGSFATTHDADASSLDVEQEKPNYFCSAFYDTDVFFGSLGSALRVNPVEVYHNTVVNPDKAPLLLTYDVPYDEDLCELMFTKLTRDMHLVETLDQAVQIDYVLVLPLWWDIQLPITKVFFENGKRSLSKDGTADLERIIQEKASFFRTGYPVPVPTGLTP